MTTLETLSTAQIRALETQAFAAGDLMMGYICRVALGAEYLIEELSDSSALEPDEQRDICDLDRTTARELVVAAIRDAEAADDRADDDDRMAS